MKKKITEIMITGLTLAVVLTGCTGTEIKNTDDQILKEDKVEETAAYTGSDKDSDTDKRSYDPAAFDLSDVYVAPEQKAGIDISGCDTFTQIVDKLNKDKGYANVTIGNTDVLMVADGTYEWENGVFAAIDADLFCYNDGVPTYLSTVAAGGTGYPLAVKDGNLYVGGNHFMSKYIIDDGFMVETEEGYVQYNTDGSGTYYYRTCNSQFEDYDEAAAKTRFDELFTEQEDAEVISFQPVGGIE